MTDTNQDFEIYAGDTKQITFTIRDENEATLNLTGYTFNWVAYHPSSGVSILTKTLGDGLEVPTPSNGKVILTLEPADTLNATPLPYDFELESTDASDNVSTLAVGTMTVLYSKA